MTRASALRSRWTGILRWTGIPRWIGVLVWAATLGAMAPAWSQTSDPPDGSDAESSMAVGAERFRRGDLLGAAASWREAANAFEAAGQSPQQIAALLHLADAQQASGRRLRALHCAAVHSTS